MMGNGHVTLKGKVFTGPLSIKFSGVGIRTINLDSIPGTKKKVHRSSYGTKLKVGQLHANQEVAIEEIRDVPHNLTLLPGIPVGDVSTDIIASKEVLGGIKDGSLCVKDSQGNRILPQHVI